MTKSELNAMMTGGFATIAGSVLAVYMGIIGADYAPHLLTASVMSAPAAFVVAKLMLPEMETSPTAGDVIYNPLYDPRGGRNAVLVGRFSGTYNQAELEALLSEINISIQSKLDKTTDFLIAGSEIYADENGDPLEEPMQPSETAVYKEAEAMGVQIVPVKIVRDFFRRTSL